MNRRMVTFAVVAALTAVTGTSAEPQRALAMGQSLPGQASVFDAGGASIRLSDLMARAGPLSALRLVRVQAEWCGTCRWHAGSTPELQERFGDRLRVIDVVLADEDNQPASVDTIRAWRAKVPPSVVVVRDPSQQLYGLIPPFAPLPWMFLVDGKTLTLRDRLSNPDPGRLRNAIERALGWNPRSTPPETFDGVFTRDQWDMIRAMRLPPRPPPDPTNRVADEPAAAVLGRRLFGDRSLSPSGRVACSSCHDAELVFTNGKDTAAEGVGPGNRNVPSLVLASHARWQLWDGRADTLWGQAVLPFEDPNEFGSSRLFVAHAVFAGHRAEYESVFGSLPPLDKSQRFPPSGKPGDPAWEGMTPQDRDAVTRVFANVGKAIAAFERGLRVSPNALDRYAAGERAALTDSEKRGLRAFFAAGCAQCHYGPRLTDDAFHNLRFPTGRRDLEADAGRAEGIPLLSASEFSRAGVFSDSPGFEPRRTPTTADAMYGAFKTPSLRGVPFTMPYGHGGGFGGLASVIEAHRSGGMPAGSRFAAGDAEPWALAFDSALSDDIQAFLLVLRLDVSDPGPGQEPRP